MREVRTIDRGELAVRGICIYRGPGEPRLGVCVDGADAHVGWRRLGEIIEHEPRVHRLKPARELSALHTHIEKHKYEIQNIYIPVW